jgi:DNA-binding response OmpR family regulator
MGPVLLVDDDDDLRDIAEDVLARAGFDVLAVSSGRDALEALATLPRPCIILLDLHMRDVSGFEVLAALERWNDPEAFQVLVVSGTEPPKLPPGARWLAKPYHAADLVDAVSATCRRRAP